jgi:hypothetical protein
MHQTDIKGTSGKLKSKKIFESPEGEFIDM